MQSLFSVFKRPSQGSDTSQRRKSSSVSPSVDSTPRHLAPPPATAQPPDAQNVTSKATALPAGPPKARVASTKGMPPPPPRSRQASSNVVPTLNHPQMQHVNDNAQYHPLYLALYAPADDRGAQSRSFRMALHLARTPEEGIMRKFSISRIAVSEADSEQESEPVSAISPTTVTNHTNLADKWRHEAEDVDTANEADLLARALIAYVAQTNVASFKSALQNVPIPTTSLPPTSSSSTDPALNDDPSTTWITHALSTIHTQGLLSTSPSPPSSTSSTAPPPPQSQAQSQTQPKPSQRPSLTHRDTDNWNDLPEDFLSADAPRPAGASARRKLRDRSIGTPIMTPRVTPRVSPIGTPRGSGEFKGPLQMVGDGSGNGDGAEVVVKDGAAGSSSGMVGSVIRTDNAGANVVEKTVSNGGKDWNSIISTAISRLVKLQEEGRAGQEVNGEVGGRKIPTLDLMTGAEV